MRRPLAPWIPVSAFVCWLFVLCAVTAFGAPLVSNVKFGMQSGTRLVDVTYDLTGGTCSIGLSVSSDNGATFAVPVKSVTGAVGNGVTAGTGKRIVWDAGTDWPGQTSSQVKVRVTAWDMMQGGSYGFSAIPGGTYQMGNLIGDADITNAGTVSVTLSSYYMAVNDTTKEQWDAVRAWGLTNGYTDLSAGVGKASDHPIVKVCWYDVIKWANAASEREGLTPSYSVGGATVKTGTSDAVVCDWTSNGYRLPTEAEWEVAARGGLSGKRFPWGDTISHTQANYQASTTYSYDLSGAVNNYNPTYSTGGTPYTSPVGSFAANRYGLYDMAGNVFQWCWDWYGAPYAGGSDPQGPTTGKGRIVRGGAWSMSNITAGNISLKSNARSAIRNYDPPACSYATTGIGFRLARGRP